MPDWTERIDEERNVLIGTTPEWEELARRLDLEEGVSRWRWTPWGMQVHRDAEAFKARKAADAEQARKAHDWLLALTLVALVAAATMFVMSLASWF